MGKQATSKLSGEERRAAIIRAVRQVFADKGFDGTTTRELAEAAGVSEALLFKHFPNKEALFAAMQESCCNEAAHGMFSRIHALEPSASTLTLLIHFLVSRIIDSDGDDDGLQAVHSRLMLRSLAEDGEFARVFLRGRVSCMIPKVEECLRAAVAAGEAVETPVRPRLQACFAHHLAAMLRVLLLPAKPVMDHGVPRHKLVEQAVWFVLRGMGLKDEAIKHYYNPKALALFET
jgi:AcrR family transcriptional regulator